MVESKQINHQYIEITGTGIITVTTTPVLAPLDVDNFNVGGVFTNAGGIVTYTGTDTGTFLISFNSTADAFDTTRTTMRSALFLNGVLLNNTSRYSYHRTATDGLMSTSYLGFITLTNGDTVEMRINELVTADNCELQNEFTNLIIKSL